MNPELCYCELSSELHVIEDGEGCELCEPKRRLPFTPQNVEAGFRFYEERALKGSGSMMKRFLLFGGDSYYPAGGWDDFAGAYDTPEEARAAAPKFRLGWFDIIDTHAMKKVAP